MERLNKLWNWFVSLLIAFDQFVNTLFGGHPDETFSASCYRKRGNFWGWWLSYHFVNTLFFWQENHCKEAYENELARGHMPKEYR